MKKSILIIEDDEILLKNIRDFLEEEGFKVITASDGIEGIKAARKQEPDLIICDIIIPYKNGYQVLSTLTKNKPEYLAPFLFLTVKTQQKDMRKGMCLGADDYIFKPFDLEDLLTSINIRLAKYDRLRNYKAEKQNSFNVCYAMEDKVLIRNKKRNEFFMIKDIKLITSKTPYVQLKFHNGKTTLQRNSMEYWENRLPQNDFIRIHRSTIVNINFIDQIEQQGQSTYLIDLKGEKKQYSISKRYGCKFRKLFRV